MTAHKNSFLCEGESAYQLNHFSRQKNAKTTVHYEDSLHRLFEDRTFRGKFGKADPIHFPREGSSEKKILILLLKNKN